MSGYPRPSRVTAVSLHELATRAGARIVGTTAEGEAAVAHAGETRVTGVTHDSTSVLPGDLYAALPGARRHGAEFGVDATRAGARAVLTDPTGVDIARRITVGLPLLVVDEPRGVLGDVASAVYGHPTARLPVIGITGTAGKTTTAYLIESGLRAAGHTTSLIGTVETRIADTVLDSVRTTPEATDLHALLASALERGMTAAVMEVSSHALAYGRVGGVRFAVGGWTNFGLDHLDFHADVDDYFAAKARLFDGRCRVEALNLDDPAVRRLVRPGTVTYSARGDSSASWRAVDVTSSLRHPARGTRGQRELASGPRWQGAQSFTARGPGGVTVAAGVAFPGQHNVANALLAIACLVAVGVDPATAAQGVRDCHRVPGRLERVDAPGPVIGVVDYAHKPDAIVAALAALRENSGGRLICVIGAGGDRDRAKRPFMGGAAATGADVVIVTDDNPRSEDPAAVRAQVRAGASELGAATVIEIAGRREAIAEAVRLAEPGDVVAVLGKGHERGQEVGGVIQPFDDRLELAAALAERYAGVRT